MRNTINWKYNVTTKTAALDTLVLANLTISTLSIRPLTLTLAQERENEREKEYEKQQEENQAKLARIESETAETAMAGKQSVDTQKSVSFKKSGLFAALCCIIYPIQKLLILMNNKSNANRSCFDAVIEFSLCQSWVVESYQC